MRSLACLLSLLALPAHAAEFPTGVFPAADGSFGKIEISTKDSTNYSVSIDLGFEGGQTCGFSGSGKIENGFLIAKSDENDGGACSVKLMADAKAISIQSADGAGCQDSCGAGASLDGGAFSRKGKVKGTDALSAATVAALIGKAGADTQKLAEISILLQTDQAKGWPEYDELVRKHILQVHPVGLKLWKAGKKKQAVELMNQASSPVYHWPEAKLDQFPSELVTPLNDLGYFADQIGDDLIPSFALGLVLRKDPKRDVAWLNLADFRWHKLKLSSCGAACEFDYTTAANADLKYSMLTQAKKLPERVAKRCSICAAAREIKGYADFNTGSLSLDGTQWKLTKIGCSQGKARDFALSDKYLERRIELKGSKLFTRYWAEKEKKNLVERIFDLKAQSGNPVIFAILTDYKRSDSRSIEEAPSLPIQDLELIKTDSPKPKLTIRYGQVFSTLYCKMGRAEFEYDKLN